MTRSLCYIQARGGSKRFPDKNITKWHGKPMVADAIIKAKNTKLFEIVAVTTDSLQILNIAHSYGALPIWRSAEASSDLATDNDVAHEVLEYFKWCKFDYICKLYPCIPLLRSSDITGIMDKLAMNYTEAVRTVDIEGNDAGACYCFHGPSYYKKGSLSALNWTTFTLEKCQDINTIEDFELAKRKAEE